MSRIFCPSVQLHESSPSPGWGGIGRRESPRPVQLIFEVQKRGEIFITTDGDANDVFCFYGNIIWKHILEKKRPTIYDVFLGLLNPPFLDG